MNEEVSEFGKGFIYNLILFAKHWWKRSEYSHAMKKINNPEEDALELWFNGASDHLYELEIPEKFKGTEIEEIAKYIREKGLEFGHGFKEKPTQKDFDEIFDKLERLAMLIDKELGLEDVEAEWK
jgi:hypothetical protein